MRGALGLMYLRDEFYTKELTRESSSCTPLGKTIIVLSLLK